MVRGVRMVEHMAQCRHRMVPCPSSACKSKILFNNVSDHIIMHNSVSMDIDQAFELHMSRKKVRNHEDWSPMVYEMQGQRFYLQCLFRNNIFMAMVIVEGGRQEAARWRSTITVSSPKKVVICESEVFPIDMTTEDIISSGDCLVMAENEMVKFNAIKINLKNLQ